MKRQTIAAVLVVKGSKCNKKLNPKLTGYTSFSQRIFRINQSYLARSANVLALATISERKQPLVNFTKHCMQPGILFNNVYHSSQFRNVPDHIKGFLDVV